MQHLVDRALPITAKFNELILHPYFSSVLIDSEEAQFTKLSTDTLLFSVRTFRIDIEEPRLAESNSDDRKHDPTFREPRILIPLLLLHSPRSETEELNWTLHKMLPFFVLPKQEDAERTDKALPTRK